MAACGAQRARIRSPLRQSEPGAFTFYRVRCAECLQGFDQGSAGGTGDLFGLCRNIAATTAARAVWNSRLG